MKKGFTLIEVMVVACILGILSAIAIPLFKGKNSEQQTQLDKESISIVKATHKVSDIKYATPVELIVTNYVTITNYPVSTPTEPNEEYKTIDFNFHCQ